MPLFRRKPKVPEWASFMTPEEYARFVELVGQALEARGVEHRFEDAAVRTPDGAIGLVNLAQMCRGEDDWPAIVGDFLDRTIRGTGQEPPERFEDAAPLLRVRLVHPDLFADAPRPVVQRPLADLVLALACDFPETVGYVPEEVAAGWGRPADELLDLGLRQVGEREEPPAVERHELGKGVIVEALHGDSLFTSTHALRVDDGLLAIPHRHVVLRHPIEDLRVLDAIGYLASMAHNMCAEGPGSISDQLYWKRGDDLVHLPVVHAPDGPQFYPPDEFVELLNGLAEPGAGPAG